MKGKYISPNSYSIPGLSDSWNSENGIVHSRPEFRYCKGKEKRNEKSSIIVFIIADFLDEPVEWLI